MALTSANRLFEMLGEKGTISKDQLLEGIAKYPEVLQVLFGI